MSSFEKLIKKILKFSLFFGCLFFPSCIKYYELAKTEFPQGKGKDVSRDILAENLKTIRVYNQFATLAIFDLLYLSDEMRSFYVDLFCNQRGKDETFKSAMLRRELEENKLWISFNILASVQDEENKGLGDKDSLWSVFLKMADGQAISPVSIEEVDLSPEMKFFFAHRLTHYKRSYLVKFPAKNAEGKYYLSEGSKFKLVVSSVNKEAEVEWNEKIRNNQENKIKTTKSSLKSMEVYEDIYWG